jgi:osmotically-inducible protein OsmY
VKQRHAALLLLAALTVAPAFAQDASKVDNTSINKRDRHTEHATAFDQSNNPDDIKLAAAVRKAILADDALSITAHNVKLVASDGTVILRGPVLNAAEKDRVGSIAKGVPGVATVENQLDTQH